MSGNFTLNEVAQFIKLAGGSFGNAKKSFYSNILRLIVNEANKCSFRQFWKSSRVIGSASIIQTYSVIAFCRNGVVEVGIGLSDNKF